MVEQWNSHGGTVWWNSVVEQWNIDGGTVEQSWWNSVVDSGTVMVEHCGGTVEH